MSLSSCDGDLGAWLAGTQGSGIFGLMVEAAGLAVIPGDTVVQPGERAGVTQLRGGRIEPGVGTER